MSPCNPIIRTRKSLRGGYGNRCVLLCGSCKVKVFGADPGNASGRQYANHMAREAWELHVTSTEAPK